MSYIIGFFSSKGGVGKTTMTANIGATLKHEFDFDVLLVDTHVLGADLSSHFGLLNPPVHMGDLLSGQLPPEKVIYKDPRTGVDIIPGPLHPDIKANLKFNKLRTRLEELGDQYDFIILDTPPWLGRDTRGIPKAVDDAFVIGTPSVAGILEAKKTIEMLNGYDKEVVRVIINFYHGLDYELHPEEIENFLEDVPILGIVPEDEKIRRSLGYGVPAVVASPDSPGSRVMIEMAAEIGGVEYEERTRGLLSRILGRFFGR
ncbi:MAG: P-loop NTPase [Candidatus Altiarchaeota archaeon]|nr:P-loop NTPase [Candidatus Altiarchaeota archaeon]